MKTKITIHFAGAIVATVLLAVCFLTPAHGADCGLDKYTRESTWYFDAEDDDWDECPGSNINWNIAPGVVGDGGGACRTLTEVAAWYKNSLRGDKLANARKYLEWKRWWLDKYKDETGKTKVHGKKLHRFICK